MKVTVRLAFVAFFAIVGLIVLVGCGSGSQAAIGKDVTISYTLVGASDLRAVVGPDGNHHDTFMTSDSTIVKVGDTVTFSVTNYDDMPHGMFFSELGISQTIKPATEAGPTTTTFSFMATKAGTFRWYCPLPCDTDNDQWAMHMTPAGHNENGFMAGSITVQ